MQHSHSTSRYFPGLERLICAAVSNQGIARLLLTAPEHALEHVAQSCALSPDERALVASIVDADDIHEFAARLYAAAHGDHARIGVVPQA
jgi:hypothetical protein